MKPSPIQLLQLTFKRVHVEIDPEHAPAEPPNPMTTVFVFDGVSITTEIGLAELDMAHERGPMYIVSLQLLIDNQPSALEPDRKFSPYRIDIEAAAIILLPKGAENLGSPHDLVSVNGAALLWSAIREQLLTLTSRMPAGPVMLPTVHFHDLKEPTTDSIVAVAPQTEAPTKKSARAKVVAKKGTQA